MFYSVLISLVLLFLGATVLWPKLREHPLVFLGYWAVCAWITVLAALLAIYDIVKVRADARRAKRGLAEHYFKDKPDDDEDPS